MFRKIILGIALLVMCANAQLPCDNQVTDCNVINTTNFANLNSVSLTYPSPTSTIFGGIVYDAVYHWDPEESHDLLHSFVVYTATGTLGTCANSKIYNNGVTVDFVEETRDGLTLCYAPISEAFDRDDLADPSKVYFLFKNIMSTSDDYFIDRDYTNPIVPAEDAIFYLYELDTTSLSTDSTGTIITLDINNITYTSQDFDGIGACDTIPETMTSIDVGGCTLNIDTSDDVNGIYTYRLEKTQYETCSNSVNGVGNLITYSSTITLPTTVSTCYYFRPGDHQQIINIEFDVSNIGGSVNLNATDVSVQITNYAIERCTPISTYILPNHRAVFTLNVTTGGETNPTISSTPYLDQNGNLLSLESTTCATHVSGSGVECEFVLKSTDCRPSFVNDDGNCIVERFSENSIRDLEITVGSSVITVAGTTSEDDFETGLENARFPGSDCDAPANIIQQNVTDTYTGTIKVRNLPTPNFAVEPTSIKFFDELILEMTIDASDLTFAELQMQSLTITIEDPNSPGVGIAQRIFHKGDKLLLHDYDWHGYSTDAHFCTYHNTNNTCPVFYQEGTDRVNAFYYSDLQARIADVCQTTGDTSIKDYFTFDPTEWFESFQLPEVTVVIDIIATVEFCDGRANSRRMLQGGSGITTVNFVQYREDRLIQTIYYTPNTESPTSSPTTGPPTAPTAPTAPTTPTTIAPVVEDEDVDIVLIIGASVGGLLACVFFIFIAKKKRKGGNDRYNTI